MAQVLECLPSNHRALNSNPRTTKMGWGLCFYVIFLCSSKSELAMQGESHFKFYTR
jgi:hypothetical protein